MQILTKKPKKNTKLWQLPGGESEGDLPPPAPLGAAIVWFYVFFWFLFFVRQDLDIFGFVGLFDIPPFYSLAGWFVFYL